MNGQEAMRKATDFLFGKKVEGTITAVLRDPDIGTHRYIVTTNNGLVDTRVRSYFMPAPLVPIYFPRPLLQRGDLFDARTLSSRPWEDGQRI